MKGGEYHQADNVTDYTDYVVIIRYTT